MNRCPTVSVSRRPAGLCFIWPLHLPQLATLLLELSLTRIFSVVFYYHFAFLAISIALFGLGVGRRFVLRGCGWPGRCSASWGFSSLHQLRAGLAQRVFVSDPRRGDRHASISRLIYFADALPFLGSGIIVSLVISETIERVDRVYFFDLLGAAGGCLLLVPLLNTVRRPEHRDRGLRPVRRRGRHLVQPGRHALRTHRQRRAGPAVHAALIIANYEISLHRSPLRQGPEAARRAVRQVEQHLAHRPGEGRKTAAR